MARLTCVYCNNVISRSDKKCPYCGADVMGSDPFLKLVYILAITTNIGQKTVIYPSS